MSRNIGTTVRGLRAPIIREGDDIAAIAINTLLKTVHEDGVELHDNDVLAITESVVARAQSNYVTVDDIAADVAGKFPGGEAGVIFPILSRNRFAIAFSGICQGLKKVWLMLSYPSDEVGNHLFSPDDMDAAGLNPYTDVFDEKRYRELFGSRIHTFTGVDYVAYYKELAEKAGCQIEIVFANDPRTILNYTKHVLTADIHSRARSKRLLLAAGAETVYGLDDLMNFPGSLGGYNFDFGLLGSNKATETKLKLFPRDCMELTADIQAQLKEITGKTMQVMVYGDGAFKDPVGKIWELADPVVSPGFTPGLDGRPNELKLKYLADNDFANLNGEALQEAITQAIRDKEADLKGQMSTQGTTPRQLTDLLGSLCDLTSGSGDKGTPIILIQGYFDNYAND
ncbi:MAG: coenzyme F420-0:L-glutamate ligase [Firmicutes bacterium]|nr:coenzyme F420-0:L-glutamate ligase [Bacillota bacterium]